MEIHAPSLVCQCFPSVRLTTCPPTREPGHGPSGCTASRTLSAPQSAVMCLFLLSSCANCAMGESAFCSAASATRPGVAPHCERDSLGSASLNVARKSCRAWAWVIPKISDDLVTVDKNPSRTLELNEERLPDVGLPDVGVAELRLSSLLLDNRSTSPCVKLTAAWRAASRAIVSLVLCIGSAVSQDLLLESEVVEL